MKHLFQKLFRNMLAGKIFSFQVQKVSITFTFYDIQAHLIWMMIERQELSLGSVYYSLQISYYWDAPETKELLFISHRESQDLCKVGASQLRFYKSVFEGTDFPCSFVKDRKIITMHSSSKSLKSVPLQG